MGILARSMGRIEAEKETRPADNGLAGTVNVSVKISPPIRVGNHPQNYRVGWGSVRNCPIGSFYSHYMYDNKSVTDFSRIGEKSAYH